MGKSKFEKWMPANEYANLNQMRYDFEMERNGVKLRKLVIAACCVSLMIIVMLTVAAFSMEAYLATLLGAFVLGFGYSLLNYLVINYSELREIIKEVEGLE